MTINISGSKQVSRPHYSFFTENHARLVENSGYVTQDEKTF